MKWNRSQSDPLPLPQHADGLHLSLKELLHYQSHPLTLATNKRTLWSSMSGQHNSRYKGRGVNFSEVRQYQVGDDIRSIDWRVTARTGKTHTKIFTEERERPVLIYIDLTQTMHLGSQLMLKSIQAAHLASLIAWATIAQQDRIGVMIQTDHQLIELKPTARQKGALRIMQSLVEAHQGTQVTAPQVNLQESLSAIHRLSPKGGELIFISDFISFAEKHHPLLQKLTEHNSLRCIQIYDPLEYGYTGFRGVERVCDHQQSQWIHFGKKSTHNQFEQIFQQHISHIQQWTRALAIPLHLISAAQPLLDQTNQLSLDQSPRTPDVILSSIKGDPR